MRNQYMFVLFRDRGQDRDEVPINVKVVGGLYPADFKGAVRSLISQQAIFCNDIFAQVYEWTDGHFKFVDVIAFDK